MRKVKRKIGHISDLAKCFSVIFLLLFATRPCYALNVSGVPDWLKAAVTRSLDAVWSEIPNRQDVDREGTLALVATRLFAGYDVKVKPKRYGPAIIFSPHDEEIIKPEIKLNVPELRGMALEWFNKDIAGMSDEIFALVENLPQSAFTWADEELRTQIGEIIEHTLPGWDFSQQIYISQNSTLINISFRPSTNLILAIEPDLYSHTVPVMIRSYLESKLIPAFSPLIGVPVEWAQSHKTEIEKFANEFLEDRHSVENLRADVSVTFVADTVSTLEARVDSKDFMFQMWVAAYAGLEGRYPEVGAFFGFRPDVWLKPEIYVEALFSLNDFDVISRLGGRFELANNFWLGIENQWSTQANLPDNEYFFRVQYSPLKIRRPYAFWRFSPQLEAHEAALGYRFDEHVSVEIYYDNLGKDKLGLRGVWHL